MKKLLTIILISLTLGASADNPIINVLAFTNSGKAGFQGEGYKIFTVTTTNMANGTAEDTILDNLDRMLGILTTQEKEREDENYYSYVVNTNGVYTSGYVDTWPDATVQKNIGPFKTWLSTITDKWISDNDCTPKRVKDALKKKYFLKINCEIPSVSTTLTAPGKSVVSTTSTSLLYTEQGMNDQIKNTPAVKTPKKNWWLMTPGYMTNGQMDEVKEVFEKIFQNINAKIPFVKNVTNIGYPWWYATPDLSKQGIYIWVQDIDQAIVAQLEIDLVTELTPVATEYGFFGITYTIGIQQPYKLWQQITINRN